MPEARSCHSAVASQGKIYVFGGTQLSGAFIDFLTDANQFTDVFVFDLAANTWSRRAPMPEARTCASAAVVNDRIFIVGGYTSRPPRLAETTLVYDPNTDSWTTTGGLRRRRVGHATAFVSGTVVALGGNDPFGGYLGSIETYDFASATWRESLVQLQEPRTGLGAAALGATLFVVGGAGTLFSPSSGTTVEEIHLPITGTVLGTPLRIGRFGPAASELGGYLYAFGGINSFQAPPNLGSGERYDPASGAWLPTAPLRQPRSGAVAVSVAGKIYVIGGEKNRVHVSSCVSDCAIASIASVEVFSPSSEPPPLLWMPR
jgi:N-acetylneuraminic acid mutarotase